MSVFDIKNNFIIWGIVGLYNNEIFLIVRIFLLESFEQKSHNLLLKK